MAGMKEGTGDDPFDDDDPEQQAARADETTMTQSTTDIKQGTSTDSEYPYAVSRDNVKEDRDAVMFHLRDQFQTVEEEIRAELAERWDKKESSIRVTDIREAMVATADTDEIERVMREWGCDA